MASYSFIVLPLNYLPSTEIPLTICVNVYKYTFACQMYSLAAMTIKLRWTDTSDEQIETILKTMFIDQNFQN